MSSPIAITSDHAPSWAPGGQQIVYGHSEGANLPHLYVINTDGTGLHQLTDGTCQEMYPSW